MASSEKKKNEQIKNLNFRLSQTLQKARQSEKNALVQAKLAQEERDKATKLAASDRAKVNEIHQLNEDLQAALAKARQSEKNELAQADIANKERRKSDSLYKDLIAQQKQNLTQLLSLARELEQKDIVQAYRIAEIAYRKDTSNSSARNVYRTMLSSPKYFYWDNPISGDFSIYSPNGKFYLITSSQSKTVTVSYEDSISASRTKSFRLI